MSDLAIDPFIKEDYLDFYEGLYLLYPINRSYYYFALSKTLKMLRSFDYPDIYEFFKNEFAECLVYAYDEMAPILSLMDFYNLEIYDNNCYKNNKIKKELLILAFSSLFLILLLLTLNYKVLAKIIPFISSSRLISSLNL